MFFIPRLPLSATQDSDKRWCPQSGQVFRVGIMSGGTRGAQSHRSLRDLLAATRKRKLSETTAPAYVGAPTSANVGVPTSAVPRSADAEVPAAGSFYAMIDAGSTAAGYSVVDANGVPVPGLVARERLRHRRWDTTAFVGFTNEKRHDGASSQHMINWQLKNHWAPRAHAAAAAAAANDADANPARKPCAIRLR